MTRDDPFYVFIPANNEGGYIAACLDALLVQQTSAPVTVIVAANGCSDDTVEKALAKTAAFEARGWTLRCLDLERGGKTYALNEAETLLPDAGVARAYLDADVLCDPNLIEEIRRALDTDQPRYATGTLRVARARTWVTRAYAAIWTRLPFVQDGVVGAGFFAVNGPGRARWGRFPDIIADDTFVRLQFSPDERLETPARYHWPMVEGLRALIRVRRRQNAGADEVARRFPDLMRNEGKSPLGVAGFARLLRDLPLQLMIYLTVHVAVRLGRPTTEWSRGR
jgi:glycosyltransferase involved in cell wall biosynthesis